ncbi:hypothetical protein B0H13DRAFT_2663042 [Mycena leptocephala]|nr:hypothetical protein B0H13DRAFT_2663042 [Mycena leptocephala]
MIIIKKLVAVHAFWRDTLETMTECFSAFLRPQASSPRARLSPHLISDADAALVSTPYLLSDAETGSGLKDSNELPTRERTSAHVLNALCGPPPCSRIETLVEALTPRLTTITLPSPSSFSSSDGGGGEEDPELSALLALCTLRPAAFIRDARGGADTHLSAVSIACLRLRRLLAAIKRALAGKVDEGHADADSLVPVLYGLCVHAALYDRGATDPRVVGMVGDIIVLVVQSLAPTRQQAFAAVLVLAFLQGNIKSLWAGEHRIDSFRSRPAEGTASERNPLILFEARYIYRRVTLDADINARVSAEAILLRASRAQTTSAELAPFLEVEHKRTMYWSDQTTPPERRRQAID